MSDNKDKVIEEIEKETKPGETKVVSYTEYEVGPESVSQKPIESIDQNNGYVGVPKGPALNNKDFENPSINNRPLTGAMPTSPIDKPEIPKKSLDNQGVPSTREQAPDIGKDYGSPAPPAAPQTRPASEVPNTTRQDGNSVPVTKNPNAVSKNNAPVKDEVPNNQTPNPNALPKKNDLDESNTGKHDNPYSDSGVKGPEHPQEEKKDESKKENNKDNNKSSEEDQSSNEQTGNGYGALKRGQNNKSNDISSNARRNLAHNNQIKKERTGVTPTKTGTKSSSGSSTTGKPSFSARIRNGIDKLRNRKKPKGKVGATGAGRIAKNALSFLVRHPFIAIIIAVIILLFILLLFEEMEGSSSRRGGTHCTYSLKGVVASGEIELSGLQVELINCDGTESNYTVLETVDFEKYVLGVALAEIGPDSPDEAIKTQIVAARNFALTRNSGMCPGNQDNCFYGYNASTGKIRMRACEADQVYWNYDSDIYRQDRGSISLYSPEVNSGTLWKSALDENRKAEVLKLAEEVKGKVLVDSSGNVVSTNYVASTSEQFISLANEGKTYDEILATVYTDSNGFGDSYCSSYGNIDYGDYVLSSDGHEILHQPLDSFLSSQGTSLEEFNALISDNVQQAGYGTRAGVVAAAVTLIAELGNNYNVKVPYYWGGGHYDGVVDGALGYWGSTQCHTYANGQSYNYCGLDCSGFVPWAIKNGGFNISQMLAGDFQGLPGAQRVSLRNDAVLEPGDLLESSGHIVLVVGIEEGNYICAEASGNSSGVLFTRRPFNSSGYWGVKMDGFYDTHVRS